MRQTRIRIPALFRAALSELAHLSQRLRSKSKSGQGPCSHTRGLTLPSRGRVPAGFARFHTPLTSNVRPQRAMPRASFRDCDGAIVAPGDRVRVIAVPKLAGMRSPYREETESVFQH